MTTIARFAGVCAATLALILGGASLALANDTVRNCDPEPTDMNIAYGEFMIGSNCVISGGGEVDLFRFNGTAGDVVSLSLGDGDSGLFRNPCFEVRDAANQVVVANGCAPDESKRWVEFVLPATGSFLILVREDSVDAVPYGLSLDRIAPPTASSDPIPCYGCEVSGSIDAGGDVDLYLLSGTAGDQILITLIDRNSSLFINPCMWLRRPDGTAIGTWKCAPDDGVTTIEETLTETGVYTILVIEDSWDAAAFGLDVQCLFGPCAGPQPLVTSALDVDGNGSVDALTDGLLLIRYFFGLRDGALINGAVAPNCQRCTASKIEAFIGRVQNSVQFDPLLP